MLRVAAAERSEFLIVHLLASRRYGGKERQILELARHLPRQYRTLVALYGEGGAAASFRGHLEAAGIEALVLAHDTPRLVRSVRELAALLRERSAAVVCSHDYKSDLLGLLAARRAGVPLVAVSHGWTGENLKVRCYEALDRWALRRADAVVCVSQGQADKVIRAGVAEQRVRVIHDAVSAERFASPRPEFADRLRGLFARPPQHLVGAAGRLSPEKGFEVLVEAAADVAERCPEVGFVLFGDGVLERRIAAAIRSRALGRSFVMPGYCEDLDHYLPHFDLLALPSFTEGLPNVVLESFAASVPVVATRVGGTPELVADGDCGYLVPPGDAPALAERIVRLCASPERRRQMGRRGRERVLNQFTFDLQSQRYVELFASLGVAACR